MSEEPQQDPLYTLLARAYAKEKAFTSEVINENNNLQATIEVHQTAIQQIIDSLRSSDAERTRLADVITQQTANMVDGQQRITRLVTEVELQKELVASAVQLGKNLVQEKAELEKQLAFSETHIRDLVGLIDEMLRLYSK